MSPTTLEIVNIYREIDENSPEIGLRLVFVTWLCFSVTMTDAKELNVRSAEEDEQEVESRYKPPPEKTIEEIVATDQEDESLRKYKEALLGQAKEGKIIVDEQDDRKVLVKKLVLVVTDRPDIELDLTGDLDKLKKQVYVIKEGVSYKIRIEFYVQREIVHGLKYVQKTYRLGVPGESDLQFF